MERIRSSSIFQGENMALDLTQMGLTDRQARVVSDLSRSLSMTEADFCRSVVLETVNILLDDPVRIGEIVKDTLAQRHPHILAGFGGRR